MVVPAAERPPSGGDSPYAQASSKKGKTSCVSSIASAKQLARGVSARDIFSRAPSRANSLILKTTSGDGGSGSSTVQQMETIEQSASDASDTEGTRRAARAAGSGDANTEHGASMKRSDSSVIRGLVANAIDKVSGEDDGGGKRGIVRSDSSVIRGIVSDAIDKVAETDMKSGGSALTGSEEERVVAIEATLRRRDADDADSAHDGEPSTADLKAELAGLQAKRNGSQPVHSLRVSLPKSSSNTSLASAKSAPSSKSKSSTPKSSTPSRWGKAFAAISVRNVFSKSSSTKSSKQDLTRSDGSFVAGTPTEFTTRDEERLSSIEAVLSKRDIDGGEAAPGAPPTDEKALLMDKDLMRRWHTTPLAKQRKDAHVPVPVGDGLERATTTRAIRARALCVNQFMLIPECRAIIDRGNVLGVRIAASFYDDSVGAFFGTPVTGATTVVPLTRDSFEPKTTMVNNVETLSEFPFLDDPLPVNLDVFFTTQIADSERLMVFELVLVETHRATGKVLNETPGGWVATMCDDPIVTKKAVNDGTQTDFSVNRGSPKDFAVGRPRDGMEYPVKLHGCELLVQIERCDDVAKLAGEFLVEDSPVRPLDFIGDLKAELFGLQVKRVAALEGRVKSLQAVLKTRETEGELMFTPEGYVSTADLKAELTGLQVKRVAAVDERMKSIEVMLSKRDTEGGESSAGEPSTADLKAELAGLQVTRVAAVDARVKSIEVMLSTRDAEGEPPAGEPSTADLKAELAGLQVKRMVAVEDRVKSIDAMLSKRATEGGESPAGEPSTADLKAELAGLQVTRVAAVDARVKSIEVMLSTRDAEGEPPAGEPSTADLKAELAGLQVKRVEAVDARVKSIEAVLRKRDASGGESPAGEPSSADLKAELAGLQVIDLVVTSPAVRGKGKTPCFPRPPKTRAPGMSPHLGRRPNRASTGTGRAQPRTGTDATGQKLAGDGAHSSDIPTSKQRSQFGPMVDSSKRSSPSVGFGSALRFDFQQKSSPPVASLRGQALNRSFSRLKNFRGVSADDSGDTFKTPGPGTYATTKYQAFGVQHQGEKRSFPSASMGKAGRFAQSEREQKPKLQFPGPDKYTLQGSLGTQNVSKTAQGSDTFPSIHFTRDRRQIGVQNDDSDYENGTGPGQYAYVPGIGIQFVSGRVTAPMRGFTKAKRFPEMMRGDDETDADEYETKLYASMGDQPLSTKKNAPFIHFGTSYREKAGLASLNKKQGKKILAGRIGPGPKYPPGCVSLGPQVLSQHTTYPSTRFPTESRWPTMEDDDEEPGPGTYRT